MAVPYAFVTLLTSDYYLPGALALAGALKDVHPSPISPPEVDFQTVCLVTPETVDVSTIKLLRRTFNVVIGVEIIAQDDDDKGLKLLGRPDLHTVLTKLHVFRLTQYSKIIFLDADVLPIRPLSHLFTLPHEFSAAPDVGWPDIFNSGVLVLSPGEDKFVELNQLLKSKGSWDGGDQGILNEWRGGDWNRLSFTYNTTPTAAYTYAPAYERYGSQISAIHFIGPNKPWNAIAHRAPFSGQRSDSESDAQQSYDYESLVDRWFAVYDKHYRSRVILPEVDFEVRKYVSAWDEESGGPALSSTSLPGGALSLEDLRKLAVEGMSTSDVASDDRSGEGEYKSMPLEGRVDLMRPQKEEEESVEPDLPSTPLSHPAQLRTSSPPRWETLPTPGPDELPPSPRPCLVSLPPTPVQPPAQEYYAESIDLGTQQEGPHGDDSHQPQGRHHDLDEPLRPSTPPRPSTPRPSTPRPSSPPMLVWNPAVEPPPTKAPTPSAFPSDTYFPNIWDQSPSKHHDQPHQVSSPTPVSGAFFQPPPPPEIPESLLRQGHYRNVTGEDNLGATPSPDRTKVRHVFPWEEKPRHMPGRVFPMDDTPPPSLFLSPGSQHLDSPSPERRASHAQPVLSPLQGLPSTLTYANAWDIDPSIQKYASRLVRPPPPPPPLAPAFDEGRRRRGSDAYRSWDERAEASSRDGDVEDEGDDDDDNEANEPQRTEAVGGDVSRERDSITPPMARSRSGSSVSASYIIRGKKKEYRVRGVQTIPREMRSQGVQVTIDPPKVSRPRDQDDPSSRQGGLAGRREWAPTTGSRVLPPVTVHEVSGGPDLSMTTAFPPPATKLQHPQASVARPSSSPPGMRSPGEYDFPSPPPVIKPTQQVSTPPSKPVLQTLQRKFSNDGSSVSSPLSSVGPLSPADAPITSPARKAGRVWDPARGVELFKRGSEEVLARFLKMGAWDEDAAR